MKHPNNIKALRLAAGMSQAKLADAIGGTKQALSMWERGLRRPSPRFAEALAAALDGLELSGVAGRGRPVGACQAFRVERLTGGLVLQFAFSDGVPCPDKLSARVQRLIRGVGLIPRARRERWGLPEFCCWYRNPTTGAMALVLDCGKIAAVEVSP